MKKRLVNERTWIRQVFDRYEAIEKRRPDSLESLTKAWPDWVFKLWHVLLKVSHPGLELKPLKTWTAKRLGQFLGRQSALERLTWDEVPLSPRVQQEKEQWMAAQLPAINANPKLAKVLLKQQAKMEKWRAVFKKFIDDTLADARTRPYAESSAFLEAFGKANVIKPDEFVTERKIGVGERIAYVMIFHWKHISKLESIGQLHRILEVAGQQMGVVITLKRVEKLCQRIGLKFRRRGRPKKKIQTKPSPAS